MKKTNVLAIATLVLAGNAMAHPAAVEGTIALDGAVGNIADGMGNAVRTGDECLRSGMWSEDNQVNACEGIADEMAAPEPAPEPVPVAETPAEPVVTIAELGGEALFGFDSDELSAAGLGAMNELIAELGNFQEISDINVVGHTDSTGSAAYNMGLSQRRAETVKNYLLGAYPNVNITAEGRGESDPVASNDTAEGRQQNRRVEIQITAKSITQPQS